MAFDPIPHDEQTRDQPAQLSVGAVASAINAAVLLGLLGAGLLVLVAAALPRAAFAHFSWVRGVDVQMKVAAVGIAILLGAAIAYLLN